MAADAGSQLSLDEIDDILYFVRVNDVDELQTTLSNLAQQHNTSTASIITRCIDPESGNTVLHFCAANGLSDLLTKLLQEVHSSNVTASADDSRALFVNHKNALGNTALHWGALNGHLPVVKQLIEARADMWTKNAAGHLAMFEAERAEKSDVVQYLLEAGGKEVENTGTEGQADTEMDGEALVVEEGAAQSSSG